MNSRFFYAQNIHFYGDIPIRRRIVRCPQL